MQAFLGELFGTATLILLGNGVVANVVLKDTYGSGSGWLVITTAWGLTVTLAIFVALAVGSNAHINPAVTVGFAVYAGDWSSVPTYIAGQMTGAIIGAAIVWLHYYPHWSRTADAASIRACFCTAPAIEHRPANFLSELIGTFMLMFCVAAIYSGNIAADGLDPGIGPFFVGLLVWAVGLSLGGTTGYAINPARDLGPRIAHAILPIPGKGGSGWDYAWIPVFGPCAGAALAGWAATALSI
ncbi:MAG TPA: MIP/aquaporin family protein [Gammaproteobacteria bacterium]|nr:MIP/aquaporin family protein [Gammaproteobacteria bacterium]